MPEVAACLWWLGESEEPSNFQSGAGICRPIEQGYTSGLPLHKLRALALGKPNSFKQQKLVRSLHFLILKGFKPRMSAWKQHPGLLLLFGLLTLIGCTDTRPRKELPALRPVRQAPQTLVERARVQLQVNGKSTQTRAYQMISDGLSLVLTGTPFGVARWDISADRENPKQIFSAADRVDSFSLDARWNVEWYGMNALTMVGRFAVMSGTLGMSVVDMDQGKEVKRYPAPSDGPFTRIGVDGERFSYTALLALPNHSASLIFGFQEQGRVTKLTASLPNLSILSSKAYRNNLCCVRGGAFFGGNAFLALTTRLWMIGVGEEGGIESSGFFDKLQVTDVVTTRELLYLQHQERPSFPSQFPSGGYVFNKEGENIAYLELPENITRFAVSPDDAYLYAGDGSAIVIYAIDWKAGPR